jgi:hypothetical protein
MHRNAFGPGQSRRLDAQALDFLSRHHFETRSSAFGQKKKFSLFFESPFRGNGEPVFSVDGMTELTHEEGKIRARG